jgi:2-polyprenyl-6-hydroxyphenyl methylase/3-demethylubiquinone-9 3-methyltransferase
MNKPTSLDTNDRFQFGANWKRFLDHLDDSKIKQSEAALKELLVKNDLSGIRFLDLGSGSGLSSLAAKNLGAAVVSVDFDPKSVACTGELKRRFHPDDSDWMVLQGSALDADFLRSLGQFEVVYSWGVLHHTGAMWIGLENAISRVAPNGLLFIAIYNDQGWKSRIWWLIKWFYNRLPSLLQTPYAVGLGLFFYTINIIKYTLRLRPMEAIGPIFSSNRYRGMTLKHDLIDWIGGFPFEFATYDVLEKYMETRGFMLISGRQASSLGCHEQVFCKLP